MVICETHNLSVHSRLPPAVILNRESATFALLINVASSCVVSAFFLIPGTNPNNTNTPVWQVLRDLYRGRQYACNHPSCLAAGPCSSLCCSRFLASSSSSGGRWRRRRTSSLSSRSRYGCASQREWLMPATVRLIISGYAHQAFAERPRRRAGLAAGRLRSHSRRPGRER